MRFFKSKKSKTPLAPEAAAPFDPDLVAQCVTEYYQLLARAAYLPPECIEYPPAGGWSDQDLAIEAIRDVGFEEPAISLLRKLPYVVNANHEVVPLTKFLDYRRDSSDSPGTWKADLDRYASAPPKPVADIPVAMVPLGRGDAAAEPWMVNTLAGTMFQCLGNYEVHDYPEDKPWLMYKQYPIKEFFDEAKKNILKLKWLPCPNGVAQWYPQILAYKDNKTRDLEDIYLKHGWPGDNFRREECMAALLEYLANEAEWDDVDDDDDDDDNDDDENADDDDDEEEGGDSKTKKK
jgi:hypothetical protein